MSQRHLPNTLLNAIVSDLSVGIMILEPVYTQKSISDFRYLYVNKLAAQLYQEDPSKLLETSFLEHPSDIKYSGLLERYKAIMTTGEASEFEHFVGAQTSIYPTDRWYEFKAKRHEQFLVVLIQDITNRKKLEQHIRQLVFQDELTGVHNRRFFVSRTPQLLSLAKRHGWSCGLLYFDLNGFKAVNDTHGHSMGDEVLKHVAWRLSSVSREQDIFFRSGGDEFALFLPETTQKSALATAQRIADALTKPLPIANQQFQIGASIGIAVMDAKDANLDTLLERADSAMYKAKEEKASKHVPVVVWSERLQENA